jgi:hypothetical protein
MTVDLNSVQNFDYEFHYINITKTWLVSFLGQIVLIRKASQKSVEEATQKVNFFRFE